LQKLSNASRQKLQNLFRLLSPQEKGHASRTALYLRIMAERLPAAPERWAECQVPEALLGEFAMDCGFYHDIGKAGADGSQTAAHVWRAKTLLEPIREAARPGDLPYLDGIAEAAVFHHERWDGRGLPGGLAGTGIPLWGRLCAAADAYERLAAQMNYISHKKVMEALAPLSGTELDPGAVGLLAGAEADFQELRKVIRR
jgi:HD-GYP domain-containing protein (c-di-GMP phosphodiesterase class II)